MGTDIDIGVVVISGHNCPAHSQAIFSSPGKILYRVNNGRHLSSEVGDECLWPAGPHGELFVSFMFDCLSFNGSGTKVKWRNLSQLKAWSLLALVSGLAKRGN